MTNAEINKLADGWIAYWNAPEDSQERESLQWVWDSEYELMQGNPDLIWQLILEILRRDSSSKIQEVLAAGTLEDLLAKHGNNVIERVEAEAKSNPTFAKLLGGVWKNMMTDDVWSRVQAAWDRRGWDGIPEN